MQTWVNIAVDKLNQGKDPQAITAELAKEGCPFPAAAVKRAMEQPDQESPVSDEIGQDPFNAPPADDPLQSGQMQGLSQQPPTLAKVRVAGTTMVGTEIERFEDTWGQGVVKIALDDGGTVNVSPSAVEAFDEEVKHPVTEIQEFIDGLPEVEPTRPSIEARVLNLNLARQAILQTVSKVAFSDQVKLESLDASIEEEVRALREFVGQGYLAKEAAVVPQYKYNAFGIAKVANEDIPYWSGNAREAGKIWASDSPFLHVASYAGDKLDFADSAAKYCEGLNMSGEDFNTFLAAATDYVRDNRTVNTEPHADLTDNEGPAEALFL